jgi:ubiquinol-cytochrome c reductase cytochrome c subunit
VPRRDAEATLLRRIVRVGLLLALLGQVAWSFRPEPSRALTDQEQTGRSLYQTSCTTCHGVDALGTENGPSLQGVGAASISFQLSTGRMPLANPGAQAPRSQAKFDDEEIAAIIAYLETIGASGEPIPIVEPDQGNLLTGASLFVENCAGCHGAGGTGTSVGGGQIAPSLEPATATQIGEAIRVGPGIMPRFGEETLTKEDVDSIAAYLLWLRTNADPGGLQLGRVGAVAEGLIAVVVGLGIVFLVVRLTGAGS